MLTWLAAARTDPGKEQIHNEDFYLSLDNRIFAVADGIASAERTTTRTIAIEAIDKQWKDFPPRLADYETVKAWLLKTINLINSAFFHDNAITYAKIEEENIDEIARFAESWCAPVKLASLILAVMTDGGNLEIAHVGDCRAYLIRDNKALRLTKDHTVAQEIMNAGRINAEQARDNSWRKFVTRCVGNEEIIEIDLTSVEIKANDLIVLCSKGLFEVLTDNLISDATPGSHRPQDVCDELIRQTLTGGAPDNVTVLVIQFFNA